MVDAGHSLQAANRPVPFQSVRFRYARLPRWVERVNASLSNSEPKSVRNSVIADALWVMQSR